jgi:cysteine desulfurase/selenocysteine lyase
MGIDLMAFAGHKGLLGPQGIGGLYVRAGVEIDPVFSGGTGGDSLPFEMPVAMPDRLDQHQLLFIGDAEH